MKYQGQDWGWFPDPVSTLVVEWIEISFTGPLSHTPSVSTLVVEWIEIIRYLVNHFGLLVSTLVVEWIEIS